MEELQQIAEILNSLGENAKWAFVFWCFGRYIITPICTVIVFSAFFYCASKIGLFAIKRYTSGNKGDE